MEEVYETLVQIKAILDSPMTAENNVILRTLLRSIMSDLFTLTE